MNRGKLFVISGPSGSGKDAVRSAVMQEKPELKFSISYTSRPPRNNPIEDAKYHFVSKHEFEDLIAKNSFLEHAVFCGNYYGTYGPTISNWLSEGNDVLVEVDVVGQKQICEKMPEAISIFIMPPSMDTLRTRLNKRNTESEEVISKRLAEAEREIRCAERYRHIVVNDHLPDAVERVCNIMDGSVTYDPDYNQKILKEVLQDA